MSDYKDKKVAFFGLGAMGFGMVHGLFKSGYHHLVLPAYRKEIDLTTGFNPLAPDAETKTRLYNEMLEGGSTEGMSVKEIAQEADVILISMPKSLQVEELMLGEEGIIENAKQGTLIIDLTSADASSTKMLYEKAKAKGIDLLDAPVSGGTTGAINQTLTIMVGGDEAVFEKARPVLETIGDPKKLMYIGPSGAGDTIKVCNNFLSACCLFATSEAMAVATKAGIAPERACEVIANSGGKSDAVLNKYPNLIFPGKLFNFSYMLMSKDVGLFTSLANNLHVPAYFSNLTDEMMQMLAAEEGIMGDLSGIAKKYEKWADVKMFGIVQE